MDFIRRPLPAAIRRRSGGAARAIPAIEGAIERAREAVRRWFSESRGETCGEGEPLMRQPARRARGRLRRPGAARELGRGGASAATDALHRVAGAGNIAALVVLCVLAANGPMVAAGRAPEAPPLPSPGRAGAGPVVFVVVDGLRVDTAVDAAVMPYLNGTLRRRGASGIARVESLIPSSIAGVVTFTTGTVPPPTAFLFDFASPAARRGGLFENLARDGHRSFVAGPRVWHDLYGRWIDDGYEAQEFLGGDASVLAAAVQAAASGRYRFVVAHLCGLDEAAHGHGGNSAEYRAAAAAADAAIRSLAEAAGAEATMVVTSDHGVTDAGAHGSPEPDVARTPIVLAGPHVDPGPKVETTQAGVWRLLADLLRVGTRIERAADVAPAVRVATLALATLSCLAGLLCFGRHLAVGGGRRLYAITCATVWIAIILLLLGVWWLALVASLAVLGATTAICRTTGGPPWSPLLAAASTGLLIGGIRLADGWTEVAAVRCAAAVVGAGAIAALAGRRVALPGCSGARGGTGVARGVVAALATAAVGRAFGQTANLSSIEVAGVFDLATNPAGLAVAAAAVTGLQAAPAGLVVLAACLNRRQAILMKPGPFLAGFSVCVAAQSLPAGWLILLGDLPAASIGLGVSLRVLSEVAFVSIGLAALATVVGAFHGFATGALIERRSIASAIEMASLSRVSQ